MILAQICQNITLWWPQNDPGMPGTSKSLYFNGFFYELYGNSRSDLEVSLSLFVKHCACYCFARSALDLWQFILYLLSGVTRVGDTRGGNWGCHPFIFSSKTWQPFFAHRCHYHYRFSLLSLGCHPLEGVTPHLFYLSDLVSPLFFVNLPIKKCVFLWVSPPWRVSPGAVRPPPAAPS